MEAIDFKVGLLPVGREEDVWYDDLGSDYNERIVENDRSIIDDPLNLRRLPKGFMVEHFRDDMIVRLASEMTALCKPLVHGHGEQAHYEGRVKKVSTSWSSATVLRGRPRPCLRRSFVFPAS